MDNEVLVCMWKVYINGKELDDRRRECVENVDINEQCDGSDTCTILVHDPDFYFLEDNIFIEEATIKVEMWWYGDTEPVIFEGFISAIDPNFPETGYPTLSIFCLDNSHVMNRKEKKRSWDNVTRPQVVQKIAQEYGFKCVIEQGYSFKTEDTISQSNQTDIEFCENLARQERDQFMCKLINGTIYYTKKGILSTPVADVHYREFPYEVLSFKPQINKETKREEVSVSEINTSDKTVDSAVASDESTVRDVQGEPVKVNNPVEMMFNLNNNAWSKTSSSEFNITE